MEPAHTLNPRIYIELGTHSDDEAEWLMKEKVVKVFMGEHEAALGMTQFVLERMRGQ